jgi:hypothetical protein
LATEGKGRTGGLWVSALDGVRGYLSISIALAHGCSRPAGPRSTSSRTPCALLCCLYLCGLPVARKTGFFWGESSVLAGLAPLCFTALLITLPFTPRAVQKVVGNPPAAGSAA